MTSLAFDSIEIDSSSSVGDLAVALLRRDFTALLDHEPGARSGHDPEDVHAMRVATRRLRAVSGMFRDYLPAEFERFRLDLRWIAGALGEVRDCDVQIEQVNRWLTESEPEKQTAFQPILSRFDKERNRARRRLLKALDSSRCRAFVNRFARALRRDPSSGSAGAPVCARAIVSRLVLRRYRKLRKVGDLIDATTPPEACHDLRIQCKRLRYQLEALAKVRRKAAARLLPLVVALQDILGACQDAQVAIARLHDLSIAAQDELPPETLLLMGMLMQRYVERSAAARERFQKAYRQLKAAPWKRLA